MSYSYRLIVLFCVFFSASTYAIEFYGDYLYWKATETMDWALINDLHPSSQNITYKTIAYQFEPGFKVGVGGRKGDVKVYYTHFKTNSVDTASGNVIPGLLAGKLDRPAPDYFFDSGSVDFSIDFNMIDVDFSKGFDLTSGLIISPLIGLKGGWIRQTMDARFQGSFSSNEIVHHNFKGFGVKGGVQAHWALYCYRQLRISLISSFATAYMWGHWDIRDTLSDSEGKAYNIDVAKRDLGSLSFHSLVGFLMEYRCFTLSLGYEINDWFNQCQIFDDGTGAHNNDLILQGVSLRLGYREKK